jgi:DNA-binding HxlR family transcriptional regulator
MSTAEPTESAHGLPGESAARSAGDRAAVARTVVTEQERRECPVTGVLRRVGDKWSPVVIRLLAEHPYGFNELDRAIEGISRRVLTRTLRGLEAEGYVRRTTIGDPPARVQYSLTDRGASLREQLLVLGQWAVTDRGGNTPDASERLSLGPALGLPRHQTGRLGVSDTDRVSLNHVGASTLLDPVGEVTERAVVNAAALPTGRPVGS